MNTKISFILLIFALAVFALPSGTNALDVTAPVIDCRNAPSSSVGRTAAMGGSFVPVSDAAVTLNTGILVYKECVLNELISKQVQFQTSKLLKSTLEDFVGGREVCNWVDDQYICENRSYYPTNLPKELAEVAQNTVTEGLNGDLYNQIPDSYQGLVKQAVYRTNAQQTKNPGASFACSYEGTPAELIAVQNGSYNGPRDLFAVADSNCNPLLSYYNVKSDIMGRASAATQNTLTELSMNNNVYSKTEIDENGLRRVTVPGFILANNLGEKLGSGFRQLENQRETGQLVDKFFSGIGNQLISAGIGGLKGLLSSSPGQPSYIDQVVANTSAAAQNTQTAFTTDAVLVALGNEQEFLRAKQATAGILRQKDAQLHAAEDRCWSDFVLPTVNQFAQTENITFTRKATSTERFAQTVIDANIIPLLSSINAEITVSSTTLNAVNTIAIGVANRTVDQVDAYNQINALRTSGALHTSDQKYAAVQETENVQAAITSVVTDIIKKWGDSMSLPEGWCNTLNNKDAVTQYWVNKWR